MDLYGLVSFDVAFDFTNVPSLVLTPVAIISDTDKPYFNGYFIITQPDNVSTTVIFGASNWNGVSFNKCSEIIRFGADGSYQKGIYSILFVAQCLDYTPTEFTRSWEMGYNPVKQRLESAFDCFTPLLQYKDNTNYGVGGYTISSQTSSWLSNSTAGSSASSTQILDLSINGKYYDCVYSIGYTKLLNYQHSSYLWLSVIQKFNKNISISAITPSSMEIMAGYLINLEIARDTAKINRVRYDDLDIAFDEAIDIFQVIKLRLKAGNNVGLVDLFNQFYNITHSYVPYNYINTNLAISTYVFVPDGQGSIGLTGATGATGGIGLTGATGPIGGVKTWLQDIPLSVWSIPHRLEFYPSVATVTSAGDKIEGDINYLDINNLTVTFGGALSGQAFLS